MIQLMAVSTKNIEEWGGWKYIEVSQWLHCQINSRVKLDWIASESPCGARCTTRNGDSRVNVLF